MSVNEKVFHATRLPYTRSPAAWIGDPGFMVSSDSLPATSSRLWLSLHSAGCPVLHTDLILPLLAGIRRGNVEIHFFVSLFVHFLHLLISSFPQIQFYQERVGRPPHPDQRWSGATTSGLRALFPPREPQTPRVMVHYPETGILIASTIGLWLNIRPGVRRRCGERQYLYTASRPFRRGYRDGKTGMLFSLFFVSPVTLNLYLFYFPN